jgi:hypothetical protein
MNRFLSILAMMFVLMCLTLSTAFTEDCLTCHREKTPAAVFQWERSAHAKAKVGCEACHGNDHSRIEKGEARVDIKVCGRCHKKALSDHQASRHGMGLHAGWGCTRKLPKRNPNECRFCHKEGSELPTSEVQCARFLKQSSEMREIGCNYCHSVEGSCASCHTSHGTDLKIVRNPNICAKCHMGPDHPQWEMWQTSLHGTLYTSLGRETGPDCQTCHMAGGSHDVSRGITMSSGGQPYDAAKREERRVEMILVCRTCHAESFARKELARGDTVREQSQGLVKEAEAIIGDLADNNMLDPMPDHRPPHPLKGSQLVLDNQMLYEDTSHIERLLFKMKKYDFARAIKGAYHQNPAYTHWYGNAEIKLDLIDIRSEASRLRERQKGGASELDTASGGTVEERLRTLKRKLERGALTPVEYEQQKHRLLE